MCRINHHIFGGIYDVIFSVLSCLYLLFLVFYHTFGVNYKFFWGAYDLSVRCWTLASLSVTWYSYKMVTRPVFLHSFATFSELPSNTSTMICYPYNFMNQWVTRLYTGWPISNRTLSFRDIHARFESSSSEQYWSKSTTLREKKICEGRWH